MRYNSKSTNKAYRIFLTDDRLDASELIEFAKSPYAGDVVYFGGTTRKDFDGKEVVSLSYEAHKGMALKTLVTLADECMARFNQSQQTVFKIAVAHRLGRVPVMEDSVMIAVSSGHRKEGWECASWLLDRIKERAEIWKLEEYADGTSNWKENEQTCVPK